MPTLIDLLSQYAILKSLAKYISALDFYHLGLTSHSLYEITLRSPSIFRHLQRYMLCDGTGLRRRQNFEAPCTKAKRNITAYDPIGHGCDGEEEVEVRIFNIKCDEFNALPCIRCGLSTCDECRWFPRVREDWMDDSRWPHLDGAYQSHTIVCFCWDCDKKVAESLPKGLHGDVCHCETHIRWVCMKCHHEEDMLDAQYFREHTKGEWAWDWDSYGDLEDGKTVQDHQHMRGMWCPCGKRAPIDGNVRCQWCKRRHVEESWGRDQDMSPLDLDPYRPPTPDRGSIGYPHIFYDGPIWDPEFGFQDERLLATNS